MILSEEYIISSVLSHHNKNLKQWTSITALGQTVSQLSDRSAKRRKNVTHGEPFVQGPQVIETESFGGTRKSQEQCDSEGYEER